MYLPLLAKAARSGAPQFVGAFVKSFFPGEALGMQRWAQCSQNNWRRSGSWFDLQTSSGCPLRQKKRLRLQCWRTKPGTIDHRTCLPLRVPKDLPSWERFPMRESGVRRRTLGVRLSVSGFRLQRPPLAILVFLLGLLIPLLLSCANKPDADTLVMLIESSPTNLDPRVGIDAQSERIDNLIFDDLLSRGDDLNVAPGLAERWDVPDPLTYLFHLHKSVKFQDGRPLTSRDVKWTFDTLLQGKIRSTKAAVYKYVDHIDTPDENTVIFHMKEA